MRKTLAMMLALALCLLVNPAPAEEPQWSYNTLNMYLELEGSLSGDVSVPAEVDGYAVNAIESGTFSSNNEITSLTMPATLRAIQDGAISWMDSLTSVTLNDGLEYIGSSFRNCNALTSLTIPASVRIVDGAIGSCPNLKEIRFEGACPIFVNTNWCFDWMSDDYVIYVPDDQQDAFAAALSDANGAAQHLRPSGRNAVMPGGSSEDWFVFDASAGAITGYTECHAFVEIPAAIGGVPVKSISAEAFRGDYSVYGIVFPEGLERIGDGAFRYASNLAYVKFPSTLRTIADSAFYSAQIDRIDWSEGLEEIGAHAFQYHKESILRLPATVKTIGESAFEGSWCQELYLGGNVESIGARAFAGTQLDYMVFDLYKPIDIAPDAFVETYVTDLDLPWDCSGANRDAYAALLAEQCPNCTVWINNPESGGVAEYPIDEAAITTIENGVWTAYHGDQANLSIWSDDGDIRVYALGDGLFKGNQTIRSFYPHHCGWFTTIGSEAFADSSVEYVEMFDSITTIGDGAFRNCTNLTELTLPASLTSIGAGALEGCTNLEKLVVCCDPAILPADMGPVLADIDALYLCADATDDQVRTLSELAGRPWYDPLTREGEQSSFMVMPYEELPGDDFWYDEEYTRLDAYQGNELNLVLPREIDGVALNTIGGGMMNRASSGGRFEAELPVVSVVIPENYTRIPSGAFQDCDALETVICYAPLEKLEEGTFSGCTSLTNVIFVNGVREIGRYVFKDCLYLETIYIGDKTQRIDENAFRDPDGFDYFTAEQCITDPAQMPDVDALLAEVACEPITPDDSGEEDEREPIIAMPIGEEGTPFFGRWQISSLEMEGISISAAESGIVMDLTLNSDGTCAIYDGEETKTGVWTMIDGAGWLQGCRMTIDADGRLRMNEDGASSFYVREDEQSIAPAPETIDVPASAAGDTQNRLERKYTCVNAEVEGVPVAAARLGGEYALTFHAGGALDFRLAGTDVPGLSWSQGEGTDTFLVDYYGSTLEVLWTEAGFDMNFFGSMLMHFAAAE